MQEEIDAMQKKIKKVMKKSRYMHSIGVRYTATALAMRYGCDIDQAATAGILHDCAKCLSDKKMLSECEKYKVVCSDVEKNAPYLLHASLGARYAEKKYGIQDSDICDAIRWHTTGKADMTLLEMIVFTADYTEPHRKPLPNLPAIRKMSFVDLEEAVYMILRDTLSYLKDTNKQKSLKSIDPHSLEAYEFYERVHNEKVNKEKLESEEF